MTENDLLKLIFLDIDGVLNSIASFKRRKKLVNMNLLDINEQDYPAEPMISNLNYIIEKTNAKIVVSSTWRLIHMLDLDLPNRESLRKVFKKSGIKADIISVTPRLNLEKCRGQEIDLWLKNYEHKVDRFVIIDDDSDMDPHMNKLVKTTFKDGLTREQAEKAIEILNINDSEI